MKAILMQLLIATGALFSVCAQALTLETDQDPLMLKVGETKKINIVAVDQQGNVVEGGNYMYQILRQEGFVYTSGAEVDSLGNVMGHSPGIYNLVIFRTGSGNRSFTRRYVKVQVAHSATAKIELLEFPERVYSGTSFPLDIELTDKSGNKFRMSNYR